MAEPWRPPAISTRWPAPERRVPPRRLLRRAATAARLRRQRSMRPPMSGSTELATCLSPTARTIASARFWPTPALSLLLPATAPPHSALTESHRPRPASAPRPGLLPMPMAICTSSPRAIMRFDLYPAADSFARSSARREQRARRRQIRLVETGDWRLPRP